MENANSSKQPDMLALERQFWSQGIINCAGVDEAGRGPLAGPVVAAAVILPRLEEYPPINDSKKVAPKQREELFAWLEKNAISVGIGVVWQDEIDRINILQAALKAMTVAVNNLNVIPDYVLVDGTICPELSVPSQSVVNGDARSLSVSAASIVAKVTRDRIMVELDRIYPQYHFASNKGYGTRKHREAIRKFGPCPVHRKSFKLL